MNSGLKLGSSNQLGPYPHYFPMGERKEGARKENKGGGQEGGSAWRSD